MKALVTGAAGFIGSRVVRRLRELGIDVKGIDDFRVFGGTHTGILGVVQGDVRDSAWMLQTAKDFQPDVVLHLAAVHYIPLCEADPAEAFSVNVHGTQVVLDTAAAVNSSRVVIASSGAVYDWQPGPLAEDSSPVLSRDIYSLTKQTNEEQLRLWAEKYKRRGVIARIFNTIGLGDTNRHLLPELLTQLMAVSPGDEAAIRIGNTESRRDYIHVDDTAEALTAMLLRDLPSELSILNVGTGSEHTVTELVEAIAALRNIRYHFVSDAARKRRTDRPSQLADTHKSADVLGWRASRDLQQALATIVN